MLQALPWVVFLGFAGRLTWIDIREHRLPNRLVGAFAVCAVLTLGFVSIVDESAADVVIILAGAGLLSACFFAVALLRPDAIGMGDVKLSVVTGMYLTWLGWGWLWWGTFLAFVLAAGLALVRMVIGSADRRTAIAFGPFMFLGVLASAGLATTI
jgi:leader peptidase (prepilin peptidase)/N-methyltransferase